MQGRLCYYVDNLQHVTLLKKIKFLTNFYKEWLCKLKINKQGYCKLKYWNYSVTTIHFSHTNEGDYVIMLITYNM
jgi:hypothetical protein